MVIGKGGKKKKSLSTLEGRVAEHTREAEKGGGGDRKEITITTTAQRGKKKFKKNGDLVLCIGRGKKRKR